MMKAAELRRHLSDADLKRLARASGLDGREAAFRTMLDHLTDEERLLAISKSSRDKIAYRAARLLPSVEPAHLSARAASAKGAWRIRAAGSLAPGVSSDAPGLATVLDGAEAARALATAIREVMTPGVMEAQARLQGEAAAALRQEASGTHVWEKALAPLLREFAWNAASAGAARPEAALEALAAAAILTGDARQAHEGDLTFQLGAAARVLLREKEKTPSPATQAIRRLAEDLAAHNAVRLGLWDGLDADGTRMLGAACSQAVFCKGPSSRRASSARQPVFDGQMLPEDWRERFALLTAAEAAAELEGLAVDPRLGDDMRTAAEFAADAARAHPGAGHVSFAEALGLENHEIRLDSMRPGRLFRAAPRGRRLARLHCRGKHGRLIRCRAAADARGALVGYLAFDPLSREIGGRPLFAAYDLEGKRQGYAWADEPTFWRAGRPEQGFVSAPESIKL